MEEVVLEEVEKIRVQIATLHFIKTLTTIYTKEESMVPVADIVDNMLISLDKFVEGCKGVTTLDDIDDKFIM
jgi:hypothetical protein